MAVRGHASPRAAGGAANDSPLLELLGRPSIAALIPARNEEEVLPGTIASLLRQSYPVDLVLVVADRCSDRTVEIARSFDGVRVLELTENATRKAGALNVGYGSLQTMRCILRAHCGFELRHGFDYVLQLDADTEIRSDFLRNALAELEDEHDLAGVCARFHARPRAGLLHRLQRIEYVRYDHSRFRKSSRVSVLSGTASVLRTKALPQQPWNEQSLVEDYALTLALKRDGWTVRAGRETFAFTETMPTLRALWRQRLRWAKGTMDELRAEGWQPYTREDIGVHTYTAAMILVRVLWIAALVATLAVGAAISYPIIWLITAVVLVVDALLMAPGLPWRERLIVLTVLPEELYHVLRQAYLVRAWWLSARGAPLPW